MGIVDLHGNGRLDVGLLAALLRGILGWRRHFELRPNSALYFKQRHLFSHDFNTKIIESMQNHKCGRGLQVKGIAYELCKPLLSTVDYKNSLSNQTSLFPKSLPQNRH
jgi:hypothetical protein